MPRVYRNGNLTIAWSADGLTGHVALDGEHCASVEWSEKRQRWRIEDSEGRCLAHVASIRGARAGRGCLVVLPPDRAAGRPGAAKS
jgi:hypothetical protein